ncbi:MAG: KH domain-containing protein [Anaerolineales bacterium]
MNPQTLEINASTPEEAIELGLQQLGLPQDAVEIEILDEGKRGLFGLGSREARVRLTVKTQPVSSAPADPIQSTPLEEPTAPTPEESTLTEDQQRVLETTRATLLDLLQKMHVQAEVEVRYLESEEDLPHGVVYADITGPDLSILIGRQSQTLQALQYITSLILGKELERNVPLIVDVQGYRTRRKAQLERLAQRMAEQVARTGRSQSLEPMTASERRIVHMVLRNHPKVYTESTGEDPQRKVMIIPK